MSRWIPGYEYLEEGRPVAAKKRFTIPRAVYDVYDEFRRLDTKDADRRARLKRIYNAFLPYDPAELRKAGQAWRTNVNFRAVANAIDARSDAVEKLAIDPCSLVTISSAVPEAAGPDDSRITTVLEEEFSRALRADGRIIPALAMMNKETDLYGIGPVTWRDPEDYVPVALERAQIVFDPDGPIISDDHEIIFVDTVLPATTVFRVLDNPELSKAAGWNVPAMRKYAMTVFRDQVETTTGYAVESGVTPEERFVELIRTNGFQEANQFRKFHVLFVYVREMAAPRKITFLIMPADRQGQDGTLEQEFLYEGKDAYDTMNQVFVWHTATSSQRYAKSVRGIASSLAPISAIQDRVLCSVVDGTIRAMSLVVKQKNPGATPMLSLQEIGPYTVVGADLEPVPNANQMSNFQGAMQVNNLLSQLGPGSVAGTLLSPTFPRVDDGGQQMSKAEAEIKDRVRTQRDENHFSSRMHAWDLIFSETWRRFVKIATGSQVVLNEFPHVKEFVARCEKRGVPKDVLKAAKDMFIVQACRDLVIGGEGIIQFISMIEAQSSGNADEAGRRAMSHDKVRYRLGAKAANRYFPEESRDSAPSNDASIATLENNALQTQQQVLVGPDQRHYPHIRVHMQVLQMVQQLVEQGMAEAQRKSQEEGGVTQNAEGELAPQVENPEGLAGILQAASYHIQQHLRYFQTQIGVENQVKEIQQTLVGMAPTIKALNLAIAEQRRVQEAEQEKQQRELEELQKRASEAETERAHYEADKQAETERYRIDRMHEVEMARLQLQGQEGQQRLAMEGQERAQRGRLDYETARNRAMIDSEMARQQMARQDQESQHGMRLAEETAANDARIRAGAVADRVEAMNRVSEVTGRQTPQPADFNEDTAAGGMIPL